MSHREEAETKTVPLNIDGIFTYKERSSYTTSDGREGGGCPTLPLRGGQGEEGGASLPLRGGQ